MRAVAFAILFLLISGCMSGSDGPGSGSDVGSGPGTGEVEIVDIHGLALDPTDASVLYVATHRGLLRLDDDTEWSYVGETRDDFMGFSAHPSDPRTFWASGHPRAGGNLGVIKSADGGQTWTRIGLEGVDFHAMAVSAADPERLYGFWRGQVMRSDDGGVQWATVGSQVATSFATHPTERDVVYAASTKGTHKSTDAGATWMELAPIPALGIAVDLTLPTTLYAGTTDSAQRSDDDGRTWRVMPMPDDGAFGFFATHATTPGLVYAASYQKGIYKSADNGATWTTVLPPSRP